MIVRDLHIENFKRLKDLRVSGLERLTVVGGMNNVGKTSLLEAAWMLLSRLDAGMLMRPLAWRGLSHVGGWYSPDAPSYYRFDISQPIRLEGTGSVRGTDRPRTWRTVITHEEESKVRRVFFTPPPELSSSSASATVSRSENEPPEIMLNVQYSEDGADMGTLQLGNRGGRQLELIGNHKPMDPYAVVFHPPRAWADANSLAKVYSELVLQGESEYVLEIMQKLEPALNSLSVLAPEGPASIFADVGLGKSIPVQLMGDGTNRILELMLAMVNARHGILFLDEIDNGLHYSVFKDIWKKLELAAKYFDCQIIATTHSYALLQAAIEAFGPDATPEFAYIRLQDSSKGVLATSYKFDELATAIQQGWEVR